MIVLFLLVNTQRWARDLDLPLEEEKHQVTALPEPANNPDFNITAVQENPNAIRSNDSDHNLETSKIKCGDNSVNQGGILCTIK